MDGFPSVRWRGWGRGCRRLSRGLVAADGVRPQARPHLAARRKRRAAGTKAGLSDAEIEDAFRAWSLFSTDRLVAFANPYLRAHSSLVKNRTRNCHHGAIAYYWLSKRHSRLTDT